METLTLSNAAREALRERSRPLTSPYEEIEPFILDALRIAKAELPRDVLLRLRRFRVDPHAPGALLLRNCPIESDLPQTPLNGKPSLDKRGYISEAALIGTAALLGEPIGFRDEKEGDIILLRDARWTPPRTLSSP